MVKSCLDFLFEKTAGDFIERFAIRVIAQVFRLQDLVDDAAFRDVEREKPVFGKAVISDKPVGLDHECVNQVVLA